MSLRTLLSPLLPLAALAACHDAPPRPQQADIPIPTQICNDVKKSLDTLEKQGGFEFTDKGQATVDQNIWMAMSADQKNSVATALAFRAGCTSGRQSRDQEVDIRGDDGTVLARRLISTKVDPQSALEGR